MNQRNKSSNHNQKQSQKQQRQKCEAAKARKNNSTRGVIGLAEAYKGQPMILDANGKTAPQYYDTETGQFVLSDGSVSIRGNSQVLQGVVNVTTAGTRVRLAVDQACKEVLIIAKRTNAGFIYVGNASVSSTAYGAELAAGEAVTIPIKNLNLVYIDASVSGEGVSYVGVQ